MSRLCSSGRPCSLSRPPGTLDSHLRRRFTLMCDGEVLESKARSNTRQCTTMQVQAAVRQTSWETLPMIAISDRLSPRMPMTMVSELQQLDV
jgi:hypothetical protein